MSPLELATRLAQLDWTACSLQHQLAVAAAVETLSGGKQPTALPVYENVVALMPRNAPVPRTRTVTLLTLDGTQFATAGFLPGLASDPWAWVCETVAAELGVDPESVGCLEPPEEDEGGGDFVTVDGIPCFRVAIPRPVPAPKI